MTARGTKFMTAFNDIEDFLRVALAAERHVGFSKLARRYAAREKLPSSQLDALLAFAVLRNSISHSRYYDGDPIADPVPAVVDQIERLRDQLKAPPTALEILGVMDVCLARPAEPISCVLDHVRRFNYSQLPVYDADRYVGILTTNAIARWLGRQMIANHGHAEDAPVSQALEFTELQERASLVPRHTTAAEAIDRLRYGGQDGMPLTALIISDDGQETDKPLAVVAAWDIPTLTAALSIA
jgi:predicted transcriptional regulator